MSEYAIGIDFGTTYSSIAVYRDGRAEVIPDKHGDRRIPSVVFFDPHSGKPTVGKAAVQLGVQYPGNCLKDVKRIIGRKFDDEYISSCHLKTAAYTLARWNNDSTVYQLSIGGRKIFKTSEEVTAQILVYLKQMASEYLNKKIKEVVVSIPATFSIAQRKAIKKAIELAGLKLLKFVSETCAGAVHYVRDKTTTSKLLVFDWGGGKIDASAILLKDKTIEVKAVAGNALVGGSDIDERLFNHMNRCLSVRLKHRILKSCIELKELLSFHQKFAVTIDCYDGFNDINLELTRTAFEDMNKDIIEKALNMVDLCLDDANWSKSSVDAVVLVGGCTRIHKIREQLQLMFPGRVFRSDFNPDEAVSAGACLEAFWHNNHFGNDCKVIEVTPFSLGLECCGHLMSVFINRNTPLPTKKSKTLNTSENFQEDASLKVFEGERKNCLHNNKLGEVNICGIPPRRVGKLDFTVTFSLDYNGFLTVTASEDSDGETNQLLIKTSHYQFCGIKPYFSLSEAMKLRCEDELFEQLMSVKQILRDKCNRLLYDLDRIELESDIVIVRESCRQFLDYSEKTSVTDPDDLMSKFHLLDVLVLPILEKNNLLEITEYENF